MPATAHVPSFPPPAACPFCAGALALDGEHSLGEGETGGMASVREYRCAGCALVVVQSRTDKIGDARETWRFGGRPPIGAPRGGSAGPGCCGALTWAAMPANHAPAPPMRMASYPTSGQLSLGVEYACGRCGATTYEHVWTSYDVSGEPVK